LAAAEADQARGYGGYGEGDEFVRVEHKLSQGRRKRLPHSPMLPLLTA
jgi:hypothetical protein